MCEWYTQALVGTASCLRTVRSVLFSALQGSKVVLKCAQRWEARGLLPLPLATRHLSCAGDRRKRGPDSQGFLAAHVTGGLAEAVVRMGEGCGCLRVVL